MRDVLRERIETKAEELRMALEETAWSKIEQLGVLWAKYGASMNLSGARDTDEIAAHVLEGLQAVECGTRAGMIEPGMSWLDVGSGAGFPGLVAAASTACGLTLMEPRVRRAAFLELALATIGARDSCVLRGRLDRFTWHGIGDDRDLEPPKRCFAIASARGVFEPSRWFEEGAAWVRKGGIVLAHLTHDAADPSDSEPVARVDGPRWSVRAYRVR